MPAAILGMVTAVGGGVLRDVLVRDVPAILRKGELYATPALAGSVIAVIGHEAGLDNAVIAGPAAAVAIIWRLLAIHRGWTAPMPG